MGAVEILIVYENLDTMRYVLRVHGAESNGAENGKESANTLEALLKSEPIKWSNANHLVVIDEKILYLTPEQEKDKSHFTDKEVSTMSRSGFTVVAHHDTPLTLCAFLRRGRNTS